MKKQLKFKSIVTCECNHIKHTFESNELIVDKIIDLPTPKVIEHYTWKTIENKRILEILKCKKVRRLNICQMLFSCKYFFFK